ncbi:MAG: FkbM family methyltransferase [bacterium]|nr:FkbM family methyltransferase [bacterium]
MSLREIYKTYFSFPVLDSLIKALLKRAVTAVAFVKGFHFPQNYFRRQRWEMLTGRYEPDSVAVFKSLIKPGMTVVDVGAHIGYFTRLFSGLAGGTGRVLALEADPFIFTLLKKNISRKGNVVARQIAVSDQSGAIDFYHSDEKSGCGSVVENLPATFRKTKLTVPAGSLDTLLQEQGITRVDFIKMDIEGGEPRALSGMRKTLEENPAIILVTEFAPEWLRAGGMEPLRFLETLKGFGFSLYAIIDGSLLPFNPKTEEEMRAGMPSYFMNICCKRD